MQFKTTVDVRIDIDKTYYICYDLPTASMLVGLESLGDKHLLGIVKKGTKFYIPIESVSKRLEKIKNDIDKLSRRKEFIEEVIKNGRFQKKKSG